MSDAVAVETESFIGEFDARLDSIAREKIVKARVKLLFDHPFFGNLASRLRLVNCDDWCETAATDGVTLYYNSRFINKLKTGELTFLIAHEVLHVAYDHMNRIGDRDSRIFNIANDYAVNSDLVHYKIGELITTVPALYDEKYHRMSSEEIYDDLMKNAKNISIDDLLDMLLDQHLNGESKSSSGDNDGNDGNGGKKGNIPVLSKAERDQISKEIKQAVISAAQAKDAGTVPANLKRMIDAFLNPTLDWRDLINLNINSTVKYDYSWAKPSRKGWHMDYILPSSKPDEKIEIDVAIDTSGSISEKQLNIFLTEIKSIMETFMEYEVNVFSFDTTVYNDEKFSSDGDSDITKYTPIGGGGTNFHAIFNHLKNNDRVPKMLIVFTDGYPNSGWGDKNYCDVTWVIHGSKSIIPPFGTWAYFE
jgi:predicted metal-dependent peptidase